VPGEVGDAQWGNAAGRPCARRGGLQWRRRMALAGAWCVRAGRSATALNRRATSCSRARRWTAPWYGASGQRVRGGSRQTDGSAWRSPWPVRRGARPGARCEGGGLRGVLGRERRGSERTEALRDVGWPSCVTVSLSEHVKLQKVE
jgi:hypothetical protein